LQITRIDTGNGGVYWYQTLTFLNFYSTIGLQYKDLGAANQVLIVAFKDRDINSFLRIQLSNNEVSSGKLYQDSLTTATRMNGIFIMNQDQFQVLLHGTYGSHPDYQAMIASVNLGIMTISYKLFGAISQ
jgi:archaellum component FlaF (FlaF/FlaG flagellin family)